MAQLCCGFFQWNISMDKIMYSLITFIWSYSFPVNICLDQDVLKTSWSRQYVCLSHMSSEDVFNTSWSRPTYSSWPYVFKTLSERLAQTSSRLLQDVFKTVSRCLEKMSCQDVCKTSSRSLAKTSSRHLQQIFKTFWRRLTSCKDVFVLFFFYLSLFFLLKFYLSSD